MNFIFVLVHILSWAVFIYLAFSALYLFLVGLCGRILRTKKYTDRGREIQDRRAHSLLSGRYDHRGYGQAGQGT